MNGRKRMECKQCGGDLFHAAYADKDALEPVIHVWECQCCLGTVTRRVMTKLHEKKRARINEIIKRLEVC